MSLSLSGGRKCNLRWTIDHARLDPPRERLFRFDIANRDESVSHASIYVIPDFIHLFIIPSRKRTTEILFFLGSSLKIHIRWIVKKEEEEEEYEREFFSLYVERIFKTKKNWGRFVWKINSVSHQMKRVWSIKFDIQSCSMEIIESVQWMENCVSITSWIRKKKEEKWKKDDGMKTLERKGGGVVFEQ